jgi:hypothetical protein
MEPEVGVETGWDEVDLNLVYPSTRKIAMFPSDRIIAV